MKTYISLLVASLQSASAFNAHSMPFSRELKLASAAEPHHSEMEIFERAVECAERFGSCDLDHMEFLARELEECTGAYFEPTADHEMHNPASMMQKEVTDRKDVAEILRMQSQLRLRMEYLNGANLFAADVHDMEDAFPEAN
eukprot:276625_1